MIFIVIIIVFFGICLAVAISENKEDATVNHVVVEDDEMFEFAQHKRCNGHCDGDCVNCPPHYGYRYGRWYYGHDHTEGCEFGGNKNGGGL